MSHQEETLVLLHHGARQLVALEEEQPHPLLPVRMQVAMHTKVKPATQGTILTKPIVANLAKTLNAQIPTRHSRTATPVNTKAALLSHQHPVLHLIVSPGDMEEELVANVSAAADVPQEDVTLLPNPQIQAILHTGTAHRE